MAQYLPLPDGSSVTIREGESPQQAWARAQEMYPDAFARKAAPQKDTAESGFLPALQAGYKGLKGDIAALAGRTGIMDVEEAEKYRAQQEAEAKKIFRPTEQGWTEAPVTKAAELLGGSLPYMAAPLAAGVVAPAGAPAIGAAGLASLAQFTGSNLSRQVEEGKRLKETELGYAAAAAVPQAALDMLSFKMAPGIRNIFAAAGKEIPEKAAAQIAKQGTAQVAKDYAKATGVAMGAEGLTEAGQQFFERLQAGLNLTDEKARDEYMQSLIGGAVLGGAIAPVGRYVERGQTQQKQEAEARAEKSKERAAAAAEKERLAQEALAAKQTPEYALKVEQDYLAAEKKRTDLKAKLKPISKDSPTLAADRAFNKDITDQIKALTDEIKPLAKEYNALQPAIAQAKESQRTAAMSPEEFMMEQTLQGGREAAPAPTGGRMKGALGTVEDITPPPAAPDTTLPDYAAAQRTAAMTPEESLAAQQGVPMQPELGAYADSLMQNPALAQRMVAEQHKFEGLSKANNNALLTGLKLRLQEQEKAQQRAAKAEMDQRLADMQSQKLVEPKDQLARLKESQAQLEEITAKAEPNFDYLDPMFEKAFEGKPAAVAVSEDVRPSAKSMDTRKRIDDLVKTLDDNEQEYYRAIRMNMADTAEKSYDTSRAALDEIKKLKTSGNPYAREVFDARDQQEKSLNEIEEALDQIRTGATLGGEKPEMADTTKELLAERADRARAQYISSVLQEAATHRRAAGKEALTQDEALKAASEMNDVLTEWSDRVQAAPRREALTEVVTPAQMRGTEIVRGAETRMMDLRPLEKRRFGAYPQAVAVLKDQLDTIRNRLSEMPTEATRVTPDLKQQFATTEAEKVTEARGETAKTLGGELRKHNEYVRNMMAKLDNSVITPRIQVALNQAADVMDSGKPSRALLNAVEEVVGRLNSGRKVEMTDLRAITDAIKAGEEIAPGQKSLDLLFEEPGKPARGIDKDLGYIRATPGRFQNAPKVQKNIPTQEDLMVRRWKDAQQKAADERAKRLEQTKKLREEAAVERDKARKAREERDAAYKARNEAEAAAEAKRREETSAARRREESVQQMESLAEKTRKRMIENLQRESLNEEIADLQKEFDAIPGPKTGDALADLIAAEGTKKAQRAAAMRKLELQQKITALQAQADVLGEPKQPKKQRAMTVLTETQKALDIPLRTGRGAEVAAERAQRKEELAARRDAKKGVVYRTTTQEGAGLKEQNVAKIADRAVEGWEKVPAIEVVANEAGLPQEIQDQAKRDGVVGKIPGLYDPKTDKVYLVASNLYNPTDVALTIAHEIAGHYGLRNVLGKTYTKVMNDIYNGNADVRTKAEGKIDANPNLSREVAVEEVLADMAEQGVQGSSALMRVFNAIKQWLFNTLGIKNVSDAEVRQIVANARRYVQTGEGQVEGAIDKSGPVYSVKPQYADADWADYGEVSDSYIAKNKSTVDRVRAAAGGFLGLETQLVDRFAGFERLSRVMDDLKGSQMMYYLRMYDQRMNFVSQAVGNGALGITEKERADGQKEYVVESKEGASIKGVVETLKDAKPFIGNGEAVNRMFSMYLAAIRGARVGFNKLNFGSETTEADLKGVQAKVDSTPELKSIFEAARTEYNEYNRNMIDFVADTGAISKELRNALVKENDYIPFYRERNGAAELLIGNENPIRIGSIKEQPYLQELVGGDRPILDFMTSSVQNTNMLADMGLRNLATKNAVFELVDMDMAKIVGKTEGPNVVKFKVNGEDRFAEVAGTPEIPGDLLVKGMEGIPTQMPFLWRAMAIPSRLLRKAVTASPLYAARQLFRDSVAAPLLSGADFTPVMGALNQINKPTKEILERRGVVGGQQFTGTPEDLSVVLRQITDGQSGWMQALAKAEAIGMEADALTRRAQYNSYIEQGLSEMEATLMSLESMNFTKRGASPSIHVVGALIPFFNAQIQALNVLYKAFTGKMPFNEKLKIQEKLLKRGAMLAAGTLAYAALMQDDEAYKNATPEQKYGNWFVRIPGVDEPVRIPVPFEVGYIFKALPEAMYNSMVNEHGGEEAVKAFKQILLQTLPGGTSYGLPQAIKPAIEAGLGKSFYTGRDILSQHEKMLLPEEQFRTNTTEMAKLMGKLGISPIVFENLVQGYTGTMGMAFLQALSLGVPTGATPEQAVKRLSEIPVVGGAFQPNDAGGIINDTYDRMTELKKVKTTVDDMMESGRTAEAKALLEKRVNEYVAADMADDFTRDMRDITQLERAVRAAPTMTAQEKRDKLDELRKLKIVLAESARRVTGQIARPSALP